MALGNTVNGTMAISTDREYFFTLTQVNVKKEFGQTVTSSVKQKSTYPISITISLPIPTVPILTVSVSS